MGGNDGSSHLYSNGMHTSIPFANTSKLPSQTIPDEIALLLHPVLDDAVKFPPERSKIAGPKSTAALCARKEFVRDPVELFPA